MKPLLKIQYELAALMGRSMGFATLHNAGAVLGELFWRLIRSRSKLATEAIAYHLDLPTQQAREIAHASFINNCQSFLEIFTNHRIDYRFLQEQFEVLHPERLEQINQEQRPLVFTSGHFGAWEIMSGSSHLLVPKQDMCIVVRKNRDTALHSMMKRLRSRPSLQVVEHRNAVFSVLKILKKKGAACFLVDHNCSREEAVFLPFLKKTAAVNKGPALLAVRMNAVVWPSFILRTGKGRYALSLGAPIDTGALTGEVDDKVRTVAEHYTKAVEEHVRQYPEQWFWMHKRWKTRPADEE